MVVLAIPCADLLRRFFVSAHSDLLYTLSIYFLVIGCAMFAVASNCADLLHRAFFNFNLFGFVVQGRCLLASGASLPDDYCCFHLCSFVAPVFSFQFHSDSLDKVPIYFLL